MQLSVSALFGYMKNLYIWRIMWSQYDIWIVEFGGIV